MYQSQWSGTAEGKIQSHEFKEQEQRKKREQEITGIKYRKGGIKKKMEKKEFGVEMVVSQSSFCVKDLF